MKSRLFHKLRVAILATACLAMSTPTWASPGYAPATLPVYLEGVTRYGCLTDCGGEYAPFCAVVNTCTGEFTGSATGCVANCSGCPEVYFCVNLFEFSFIDVAFSVYVVGPSGNATYVAIGCIV